MSNTATTEKEFAAELAELAARLKADIAAFHTGLDPSPAARAERRKRVLVDRDFAFFAYTYFPHHVRGGPSLFQAHFCQRYPQILANSGGATEWWIAPRGEAKSSLLTKIGPTWCAVQGLLQKEAIRKELDWPEGEPTPPFIDYIILLGAETKLPTKLLEVCKTELMFNAALALDFPEACGKGPLWKVGEFVTKTGVKVEPFGAEQAIRGTFHGASRPKLLLGDDLITDAEAKSPTERDNRWEWLTKAIDYLGPPDGSVKFVGVGTILNKDDPISRAKRTIGHVVHHFRAIATLPTHMDLWATCQERMLNDDLKAQEQAAADGVVLKDPDGLPSYQFYLEHKASMDEGAVISWPAVRSLYWLMRQRAKAPRAFGTEMQGEPRNDEDKIFSPIRFWVNRLNSWVIYGGCDPSMGAGQSSHPSALIAGGLNRETGQLHVIGAHIKRRVPSKLYSDLISFQMEYKCTAIGFENNNAYEAVRQAAITEAMRQSVPLPLVGLTESLPREVRIDGLEPFVTDPMEPKILFGSWCTQLLAELDSWPEKQSGHDYDGLSALYVLWKVAHRGGGGSTQVLSRPRPSAGGLAARVGRISLRGY